MLESTHAITIQHLKRVAGILGRSALLILLPSNLRGNTVQRRERRVQGLEKRQLNFTYSTFLHTIFTKTKTYRANAQTVIGF